MHSTAHVLPLQRAVCLPLRVVCCPASAYCTVPPAGGHALHRLLVLHCIARVLRSAPPACCMHHQLRTAPPAPPACRVCATSVRRRRAMCAPPACCADPQSLTSVLCAVAICALPLSAQMLCTPAHPAHCDDGTHTVAHGTHTVAHSVTPACALCRALTLHPTTPSRPPPSCPCVLTHSSHLLVLDTVKSPVNARCPVRPHVCEPVTTSCAAQTFLQLRNFRGQRAFGTIGVSADCDSVCLNVLACSQA